MTDHKAGANHDAPSPTPSLRPNQHEENLQPRHERKAWRGTVSLAVAETTSWASFIIPSAFSSLPSGPHLLHRVLPLHATLPSLSLSIFNPSEKAPPPSPSQQRRLLSVLAIVLTSNSIATTGIGVHLVPYLQTSGFSLQEAASVMAFVGAAQVPGRLLFRPLELLLVSQWRFAFVLLTQALGLLGLLYPNRYPILIFAVILWGRQMGWSRSSVQLFLPNGLAENAGVQRRAERAARGPSAGTGWA